MNLRLTDHAKDVIVERRLKMSWIYHAVERPEIKEDPGDGTIHYLARISERGNLVMRVIVNPKVVPPCMVTAFFDRRMKGKLP